MRQYDSQIIDPAFRVRRQSLYSPHVLRSDAVDWKGCVQWMFHDGKMSHTFMAQTRQMENQRRVRERISIDGHEKTVEVFMQ
jgi:hypothetical protein